MYLALIKNIEQALSVDLDYFSTSIISQTSHPKLDICDIMRYNNLIPAAAPTTATVKHFSQDMCDDDDKIHTRINDYQNRATNIPLGMSGINKLESGFSISFTLAECSCIQV